GGRSTRRAVRDEGGVAMRPDVHAGPAAVGCRPYICQYRSGAGIGSSAEPAAPVVRTAFPWSLPKEKDYGSDDLGYVLADPRGRARARLRAAGRRGPEGTARDLDGHEGGARRQRGR